MLTFDVPHGTSISVGKLSGIFSISHELQQEYPPSGIDMRIMPVPAFGGPRAAMGEYFVAPPHLPVTYVAPSSSRPSKVCSGFVSKRTRYP